jgi:hypothetical protein
MLPDELSDLERRLAACQPSADGLDEAAVLFAAGRADASRGRWRWPLAAAAFAVLSAGLGAWGWSERAARLAVAVPPAVPAAPTPEPLRDHDGPTQWELRRSWERDPERATPEPPASPEPPGPDGPVLRAFGGLPEL